MVLVDPQKQAVWSSHVGSSCVEVADTFVSGWQGWWLLQLAVLGILTALSGAAVGNGPGLFLRQK